VDIGRWFALRLDEHEIVYWKNLPMGSSWSPYCTQSIAFLIILIVLDKMQVDIGKHTNITCPPPVLTLPEIVIAL
jgi:hypothetical protein